MKERENKPTGQQNMWRNPTTNTVFEISLAENQNVVKLGSKSWFSVSKTKRFFRYIAMEFRYPQPLRIHQRDQECDVMIKKKNTPSKEVKTSTDLHQGQQLSFFSFLFKKNGTTYGKPWEGTDAFLAPWKQKNCQKSQPESVFKF